MVTPDTPETLDSEPIWGQAARRRSPSLVPGLVIVWHAGGDERVGEVILLTSGPAVIGRGDADSIASPRATPCRQRPGLAVPRGPLAMGALSRDQVLARPLADGRVVVERVGRCQHLINGAPSDEATLEPGDVLHIKNQVVLLLELRPAVVPALAHLPRDPVMAFGEVDGLGFVGEHPSTWAMRDRLAFIARTGRHVLITGPSGSGKEAAARALHTLSSRAHRPLIARNAATLPPGLIDAELFGNVRGYPHTDMREREGLIGEADRGTLFLDEVAELPLASQAHLLRVLDSDGDYQRLGEARVRRSDFCFIGATNQSPELMRPDFLARFKMRLELDGLDARRSDIPLIMRHMLRRATVDMPEIGARFFEGWGEAHSVPRVTPELVEHLVRHDYQTHVREMDTILWTAITSSPHHFLEVTPEVRAMLTPRARPLDASAASTLEPQAAGVAVVDRPPTAEPPGRAPGELERHVVEAALRETRGNVRRTAMVLGLPSRYALYRLLDRLGIDLQELRKERE